MEVEEREQGDALEELGIFSQAEISGRFRLSRSRGFQSGTVRKATMENGNSQRLPTGQNLQESLFCKIRPLHSYSWIKTFICLEEYSLSAEIDEARSSGGYRKWLTNQFVAGTMGEEEAC